MQVLLEAHLSCTEGPPTCGMTLMKADGKKRGIFNPFPDQKKDEMREEWKEVFPESPAWDMGVLAP